MKIKDSMFNNLFYHNRYIDLITNNLKSMYLLWFKMNLNYVKKNIVDSY